MPLTINQRIENTFSSDAATYAKLFAVSVIWGGTFVAGRFVSHDMAPILAASIRFFLASVTLVSFMCLRKMPIKPPNGKQIFQLFYLGFFGIFTYNLCFFYGLHYISASRASLIVALNPAAMGLMSFIFLKEKLTRQRTIGIFICLAGATIVILNKNGISAATSGTSLTGDILIFGCVISWVIYSVFSKEIASELGSLPTVTYSVVLGTGMLICASLFLGQLDIKNLLAVSSPAFSSLLYLGVIGSALAYIWYYDGIGKIGATRAGVFIALNPMTAVLAGAVLLGESVSLPVLTGGAIIVLGIFLCNRRQALPLASLPTDTTR